MSGDKEPFDAKDVGANGQPNSYECFFYEAPWGAATQLIGHRPIIDNERVIHHVLLYASVYTSTMSSPSASAFSSKRASRVARGTPARRAVPAI